MTTCTERMGIYIDGGVFGFLTSGAGGATCKLYTPCLAREVYGVPANQFSPSAGTSLEQRADKLPCECPECQGQMH